MQTHPDIGLVHDSRLAACNLRVSGCVIDIYSCLILLYTADNQVQETVNNDVTTESTTRNEKPDDTNEGAVSQDRSHDNVFKASGARSEKAKQVEDDKGTAIHNTFTG